MYDIVQTNRRLIASRNQIGQRDATLTHRQVDTDVAGLRYQRHTTFPPLAAVHIRPQQRAVEIIDQAVTVRTQDGHGAGRRQELILKFVAFITHLAESGCVTHRTTRPNFRQ